AQLFRIERVKLVLHLQQPAASRAKIGVLLRVLPLLAAFFDALEVGGGHWKLSVVSSQLSFGSCPSSLVLGRQPRKRAKDQGQRTKDELKLKLLVNGVHGFFHVGCFHGERDTQLRRTLGDSDDIDPAPPERAKRPTRDAGGAFHVLADG